MKSTFAIAVIAILSAYTSAMPERAVARQAATATPAATSTPAPTTTLPPDPWKCATMNVTQYLDVTQPTGSLLSAVFSYGSELIKPCLSTATGKDRSTCTISSTSQWCGLATAAPSSLNSANSAYGSGMASWWKAKSSAVAFASEVCPLAWQRGGIVKHAWFTIAVAHASCYMNANPGEFPTSSSPQTTRTVSPGSGVTGGTPVPTTGR